MVCKVTHCAGCVSATTACNIGCCLGKKLVSVTMYETVYYATPAAMVIYQIIIFLYSLF